MKKTFVALLLSAIFVFVSVEMSAQKKDKFGIPKDYQPLKLNQSNDLQSLLDKAVTETLEKFSGQNLKRENLAATVIDMRDTADLKTANFRGQDKIYPASVVKMFFDAAYRQWLKDGKLKRSPALDLVEKDMIVVSSNEATQYMVDALTDTHNGETLAPDELKKYGYKRDIVNRYFTALGYQNIVVNQKTYEENLYGRERQWWNEGKNRNMLTTNATARLLAEIVLGKAVNAEHSRQMLELMKRNPYSDDKDSDSQDIGFTGIALKNLPNVKLWSKAGWTSRSRHDAAYVETADGLKFVIVVFTEDFANERNIIPSITVKVLENLGKTK